jgi:hypothetical protein
MRRHLAPVLLGALLVGWTPSRVVAVTLHAGDVVLVDSFIDPSPTPAVWRVDPATLDTTRISAGGLLVNPDRIAVDAAGHIIVADQVSGLVSIDATTGAQTLLLAPSDIGGRAVHGVCRDPAGGLYLTAGGGAGPVVLHFDPSTRAWRIVTSSGNLVEPRGIAAAPGGTLYVADGSVTTAGGTGGIVAVTPGGTQTLLAITGAALRSPFDLAVSPDGYIWSAQWGGLSRRGGGFLRTRISDGYTDYSTGDRSQGITISDAGVIYTGDCISISLDCYNAYRNVAIFPPGPMRFMPAGGMAVVPSDLTPVHPSTWGSVKTRYR